MHSQNLHRPSRAFTLIELMVVIGIIGVLAGLLLTVIAKVKDKGRRAGCLNNIRQLSLGFIMYHGDHEDVFPAPGSASRYGPQPEDWIWWQYGRGVTNSSIVPYVEAFKPKLFTCPSDLEARELQDQGQLFTEPYRYSYSLTSYDLDGERNPGMATIITPDRQVFKFRASSLLNPSAKIMLVEEDRETIDDPRWVPMGTKTNRVSGRHDKLGNVAFADGHIQAVEPEFGLNPTNSMPLLQ